MRFDSGTHVLSPGPDFSLLLLYSLCQSSFLSLSFFPPSLFLAEPFSNILWPCSDISFLFSRFTCSRGKRCLSSSRPPSFPASRCFCLGPVLITKEILLARRLRCFTLSDPSHVPCPWSWGTTNTL